MGESREAGKKVRQGGPTGAKGALGKQIYPRDGGHPRHFLGISWAGAVLEKIHRGCQVSSCRVRYMNTNVTNLSCLNLFSNYKPNVFQK